MLDFRKHLTSDNFDVIKKDNLLCTVNLDDQKIHYIGFFESITFEELEEILNKIKETKC